MGFNLNIDFMGLELKVAQQPIWDLVQQRPISYNFKNWGNSYSFFESYGINSNGNVGIGINNPLQKLHVKNGNFNRRGKKSGVLNCK